MSDYIPPPSGWTMGSGPSSSATGGLSLPSNVTSQISTAAESLFSNQLASALSTISDSQYFQDSIPPSQIRTQLTSNDPSNPASTPAFLKSIKWLLASISKGRDVSDFFPHVVKLVQSPSLEIRKMVYMYLVHYADHDATCRDLALLSINAFQRGLTDKEQWIRALALRVLTSIRVNDVLQIQIMACISCGSDASPYVRKCAVNALGKLYPRCPPGGEEREQLVKILGNLLGEEGCTMVLTSAMVSFVEICPDQLDLLHGCFRKVCHLLADMDEWGQVVIVDVLSRYCRRYFRKPLSAEGGRGSAELIDESRRVVRRLRGGTKDGPELESSLGPQDANLFGMDSSQDKPNQRQAKKGKEKRRVVKKGFYSDEEDESTDEEDDGFYTYRQNSPSLANAMRQRDVLGFGNGISGVDNGNLGRADQASAVEDTDSATLDEDHRLLLKSSIPLLKSRNAGVVMGVCSLHYYCGVSSIKIRSAMGKSLVRIYHDRREIQFVVLKSIRTLVWECPSAFTPFLDDFFVKAMDPSFTRIIKLDILCALVLEPTSINAVLEELRTYIRHNDKVFVCASVRAVGKIVEMARVVYDRQGVKIQDTVKAREDANLIALNCLYGLLTLTESSDNADVVGACVETMQRIISLLLETFNVKVNDPNNVVSMVMRKIVLLLIRSLTADRDERGEEKLQDEEDYDSNMDKDALALKSQNLLLPTEKVATALWIVGEWLSSSADAALVISDAKLLEKKMIRSELLRHLARFFPEMGPKLKLHSLHLASKVWLSSDSSNDFILCEYILGMGRVDITPDVRDRARYESQLLHLAKGLKSDVENLPKLSQGSGNKITAADAKGMLLKFKPPSSWLPIEKNDESDIKNCFRFGSLSSMFSHKAGDAYMPLPPWASVDSPKSLRDPPQKKDKERSNTSKKSNNRNMANSTSVFYESSTESSGSSDDSMSSSSDGSSDDGSSSSSSSSYDQSSESEDESSEDDDESTDSSDEDSFMNIPISNGRRKILTNAGSKNNQSLLSTNDSSSDSDDESSSSSDSSSEVDINQRQNNNGNFSLIDIHTSTKSDKGTKLATGDQAAKVKDDEMMTAVASGLEGLVMAPLVVEKDSDDAIGNSNIEMESSNWNVLVRNDLSGGLSISARYLRGATRKHEANLLGLDSNSSTVVTVQLKLENRRNDGKVLRRIRLMQRKIQNSNIVATTRVLLPQEISLLPSSKVSYAIVGIEFANASDKDGAMMTRFDAKCDRSTTAFDIQPALSELLVESKYSRADFDAKVKKLGGVHQSAKSSFLLAPSSGESVANKYNKLPAKICKFINISPLKGNMDWFEQCCRFIGHLPASGMDVLVVVRYSQEKGSGEIVVHCDSPVALNCILVSIKNAVNA